MAQKPPIIKDGILTYQRDGRPALLSLTHFKSAERSASPKQIVARVNTGASP